MRGVGQRLLAFLVAAGAGACATMDLQSGPGGPGGTPTPSGSATPTPVGSGTATPTPTATPTQWKVYVNSSPHPGPNAVVGFILDKTGALTAINGSPWDAQGGDDTFFGGDDFSIASDGANVYVTDSAGLVSYSVGAGGALTSLGTRLSLPFIAFAVAVDSVNHRLFVSDCGSALSGGTNAVKAFSLDATGKPSPLGDGALPSNFCPDVLTLSPDGTHLYVNDDSSSNFYAFNVSAAGTLTAMNGAPFSKSSSGFTARLDPLAKHLYIPNYTNGTINGWSFDATGKPSGISGSPFKLGNNETNINVVAFRPDGKFAYAVYLGPGTNGTNTCGIATLSVDATTGALQEVGSPLATPAIVDAGLAEITPDGSFLVVGGQMGNSLTVFSINAATGALTQIGQPVLTGVVNGAPTGLVIVP